MSEENPSDLKKTLRQQAMRHRAFIEKNAGDAEEAAALFMEIIAPGKDQVVAAYWPKDYEFDTSAILESLLEKGIPCALPVVEKGSIVLRFAPWSEETKMETGVFGVLHPEINEDTKWLEPDILIVPMLAFDRQGGRLGYGGGYYDATLEALRKKKNVLAVGLAYAQQAVLFNLPAEPHDEKLDWVITPQGTHYFGQEA